MNGSQQEQQQHINCMDLAIKNRVMVGHSGHYVEVFKNGKPLIGTMKSQLEQMIDIMNAICISSYIFPERILFLRIPVQHLAK